MRGTQTFGRPGGEPATSSDDQILAGPRAPCEPLPVWTDGHHGSHLPILCLAMSGWTCSSLDSDAEIAALYQWPISASSRGASSSRLRDCRLVLVRLAQLPVLRRLRHRQKSSCERERSQVARRPPTQASQSGQRRRHPRLSHHAAPVRPKPSSPAPGCSTNALGTRAGVRVEQDRVRSATRQSC